MSIEQNMNLTKYKVIDKFENQEYILIRVWHFDFSSYELCEHDFRVFLISDPKSVRNEKHPKVMFTQLIWWKIEVSYSY